GKCRWRVGQQPAPRRVAEPGGVRDFGRGQGDNGGLPLGLQPSASAQCAGVSDPGGVRRSVCRGGDRPAGTRGSVSDAPGPTLITPGPETGGRALQELSTSKRRKAYAECIALCREGVSLSQTPNASEWYAFRINLANFRLVDMKKT